MRFHPLICQLKTGWVPVFLAMICLIPVVGILAPRAMAFLPLLTASVGCGLFYRQMRCLPQFDRALSVSLMIIILLIAASALWAMDLELAISRAHSQIPTYLGAMMIFALARNITPEDTVLFQKFFPWAIVVAGSIILLMFISASVQPHPVTQELRWKVGNLSHYNRGVVIFVLCAVCAFAMPLTRIQMLSLICVTVTVMIATDSQTAQLALIIGMVMMMFFPAARQWAQRLLIVSVMTLMLAAPFLAQAMFHHLAESAAHYSWLRDGYAASRMEIWDFVARRALEHPVLGFGIEATRLTKDFDIAYMFHKESSVLHPHNFALQIWIEFGAIGAAIFAGLLGFSLQKIMQQDISARRSILAIFMAALCVAATSYGFWQGWWQGTLTLLPAVMILVARTGQMPIQTSVPVSSLASGNSS
jgi:O-antigen ligase